MIFVYDKRGVPIIATQRILEGIGVTGSYYKTFAECVTPKKICKVRPELLESGAKILHDNVDPHKLP